MGPGTRTANILDIPQSISSVVVPYLGDNGYKYEGIGTIRVLSIANGTLGTYDETSATAPFGAPALVVPVEQVLSLAYNRSMLLRIQRTQIQDIPVNDFVKKVALQQADQVFIPTYDAYVLAKIFAARPVGNRVYIQLIAAVLSTEHVLRFNMAVDRARTGGSNINNLIAWVSFNFGSQLKARINFTGSDAGYVEGKNGFIGKFGGAKVVEVPDLYLTTPVYALIADKNAVVNVTPKMDPKGDGLVVIEKVALFSGIEIQLRARGDAFVLNRQVNNVSSLEEDPAA